MQFVPLLAFFRLPAAPACPASHLSSRIVRVLVTCGCLAAFNGLSSALLPDESEAILI